ncbi:MAG: LytTR family transcriptional regulator [Prolixibacteraceae bacterium]|jgi:two-component system, LytTR family, response regulator|nr:LytTR family transcriptional regulator [Prolixibacteraceae bacterium]MBT6005890.1 LytTR family transcriptional regulator [Prolixibacteraceae bacterium]MBT6763435.1 LytTR family transcriptional regulator [Prolixibacteraceae bacterium]MBT6996901.1 LytTR family transcriptional regulator [Prolixibacteraceae bacterium]MBT7393768.1 LytTR family transcriptional regulator [Prolixibacteraceae bacterium]
MLTNRKLVLNTIDSIHLIQIENILFCKSNNSYTTFYLTNQEPIVVSRNIKEFETELIRYRFFRTHQSYLVNLMHISKIDKSDGFKLILSDNTRIPTSTRKKKTLLQILQNNQQFQNES